MFLIKEEIKCDNLIIGGGLVGNLILNILKREKPSEKTVLIAKDIINLSENKEKEWYFMAEKEVVERNLGKYDERIDSLFGPIKTISTTYIGQHSCINEFEEVYESKTKTFSSGTSKSISFRKYFMDKRGFVKEGSYYDYEIYGLGDWVHESLRKDSEVYREKVVSINIEERKVITENQKLFIAEKIFNTIPLDLFDELSTPEHENDNLSIENSVSKSLSNYQIYLVKHLIPKKDFFFGRRFFLKDIVKDYLPECSQYIRVYDFDKNSPFYQHIIHSCGDNYEINSLSMNHGVSFSSYKSYNPGRIRRVDDYKVSKYLDDCYHCGIFHIGRYARWEGARTLWNDAVFMYKNFIGDRGVI